MWSDDTFWMFCLCSIIRAHKLGYLQNDWQTNLISASRVISLLTNCGLLWFPLSHYFVYVQFKFLNVGKHISKNVNKTTWICNKANDIYIWKGDCLVFYGILATSAQIVYIFRQSLTILCTTIYRQLHFSLCTVRSILLFNFAVICI